MDKIKEVGWQCTCLSCILTDCDHRQKLNALRAEADANVERAEQAEAMNKKYEQEILEKDQDIISLQHKLSVLDGELEKAEAKLADAKIAREEGDASKTTNENLTRKIQLLEEELDTAEKNVKETVEKYVTTSSRSLVHRF
jgi:tropomyosin, fungi type